MLVVELFVPCILQFFFLEYIVKFVRCQDPEIEAKSLNLRNFISFKLLIY